MFSSIVEPKDEFFNFYLVPKEIFVKIIIDFG